MLRTTRLPVYLLAITGLVLVLAGVTLQVMQPRSPLVTANARPAVASLPRQLAGQDLTSSETGQAALAEIETMHGRGFALTSGEIAHYGDATVWIAHTVDAASAEDGRRAERASLKAVHRSNRQARGRRAVTLSTL
jgi:hypothetical protein